MRMSRRVDILRNEFEMNDVERGRSRARPQAETEFEHYERAGCVS